MTHVLFVCSQNMLRSPTAERVFKDEPGVETRSAGTDVDAEKPLTAEMIEWADIVVVMETHHERAVRERFFAALGGRPLVVLRIRDEYEYMQPELVAALRQKRALWAKWLPDADRSQDA